MRRNLQGIHETKHYNLGRGILYIAKLSGQDKVLSGWEDIGNLTELSVAIDTDELDHKSTRDEISLTDVKIVTKREVKVNFKSDSVTGANLSKYFSSVPDEQSNVIVFADVVRTIDIKDPFIYGGRWYDIKYFISPTLPELAAYDSSGITISGAVEGTDFIADNYNCRFFIPANSSITPGNHTCTALQNASSSVIESSTIRPFNATNQKFSIKFISANPNEVDDDYKNAHWHFFKV